MKKTISYIVLVTFCISTIIVNAQVNENKSSSNSNSIMLRSSYEKRNLDDLLDSAKMNIKINPIKAFDYVEDALLQNTKYNKDNRIEANSYNILGDLYFNLNQPDLAINNYIKAYNLFLKINDNEGIYNSYKNLANAYKANKQYDTSLEYFNRFLKEAQIKGRKTDIVYAKNNIAAIYSIQGKYEQSKNKVQEVLDMEIASKNTDGYIIANEALGDISLKEENPKQAIQYYDNSIKSAEQTNDTKTVQKLYSKKSQVYRANKQYDEELEVRKKSLSLGKSTNDKKAQTIDNLEIGNIYIEEDNAPAAIPYLRESVNISEETKDMEGKGAALQLLSKAYDKMGNQDKALSVYKQYVTVIDAVYKKREEDLLAKIEINNSLIKKLQRIDLLEKDHELSDKTIELLQNEQKLKDNELDNQRIIIYSLLGGFILLIISSLLVFRSLRQRRIANQLLALKSLRSQMNPHFIFNALNSVNSFISKSDEKSANKYLSEFSRLMRSVMENSQQDFIPLSTEIQILESYLSLEHSRFNEKFDYTFNVDNNIDKESFEIPPMLIQPYIENSIWHGLRYKEDKGVLNVSITKANYMLKVIIEDNGIGRAKSQELKTINQKRTISTGLKNIENRLKIINDLYKSKIIVEIEDVNNDKTGTRVIIYIPQQKKNNGA